MHDRRPPQRRTATGLRRVACLAFLAGTLARGHSSAAGAQVPAATGPKAAGPRGGQAAPAAVQPPGATHSLADTVALKDFIDGVMKAHVEELHIPAAVIAVIKDGRVLYARGYGFADSARATPIDPATSLFRIGSTSKLFTWTAVMQLVEQGKLSLDADVNTYIKGFRIPNTFPQPITLRHLMTHSAGFEDGGIGYLIVSDPTQVKSIAATLAEHMPARVRPPGVMSSYSNYSAALAGLIVEQVSGVPFNEYIRRNILEPLDMRHATFQEPLPAELKPYGVTGSARENGVYVAKPFEYVGGFRPAGSGSMSALDMTHFMIAHLQDGQYGTARILKPETARLMHTATFANDPRLPAMALGFYEQRFNGTRVIGHAGDTQYFHTEMFIVPDQQAGIFVSYVGNGGGPARDGMMRAFFDRYFPATAASTLPAAPANFATTAAPYTGAYRFARHSSTKFEKAFLLAQPPISVTIVPKQGRLLISGLGATPSEFAPLGNDVFRQVEGHQEIAFRKTAAGTVDRLSVDALPFMATERVPWYEMPSLWYTLLGLAVLLFLTVFTGLYYRRKEIGGMVRGEKRALWLSVATAGWFFLTVIVIGVVLAVSGATLFSHIPTSLEVSLVMPIVFVLLTVLVAIAAVQVWRGRYWTTGRRVHFTLVALAAVAVCLFFNQWNLLGWRFG